MRVNTVFFAHAIWRAISSLMRLSGASLRADGRPCGSWRDRFGAIRFAGDSAPLSSRKSRWIHIVFRYGKKYRFPINVLSFFNIY